MIVKNADAVVKFLIDLSEKGAIKGIEKIDKKSEILAQKFNKAGKALTIGLTTPIVAFGTYAVKTATDFGKAVNQMNSSLGTFFPEAEYLEDVLKKIYNANYGESYEDIANAISIVGKEIDGLDETQLENITESALTLRDTFGVEVNESIRASKALITQFGISAEEAYNLMAQGAQGGLDFSGELIDNINEYSVQFKKLGLSAEDMFNIFQSGADAGAWNLDKIGDAIKEFSIRAIDGSNTTIDGFKKLGMNADKMAKKFASGGDTAKQAFYETIDAIKAIDDPVQQSIVGVDLFGTMWEDLGPQVVTQLGSIRDMYDGTNESMNKIKEIKYDDLGSMIEAIKRQFGDIVLTLGNELMPHITSFTGKISSIIGKFKELSPETQSMVFKIMGIAGAVGPLLIILSKLVPLISTVGSVIGTLINPVGLIIVAIGALIGVFVYLMSTSEEFRQSVQIIFSYVWSFIQPIIQNIMNLFNGLVQIIKGCVMVIAGLLTGDFQLVANGFSSIFRGIGNVAISVLNGVINTINKFVKLALIPINAIISAINHIPGMKIKKINLAIPNIPSLNVGTNYVAHEGIAYLHEGEAVVPKKYNPAIGGYGSVNPIVYVTVNADMDVDKFGNAFVRDIKTFSGGAKNSYNFGGAK